MKQVYTKSLKERVAPESSLVAAQHVPLHPVQWLHFFFEGVLEAAAEGASQSP